MQTKEQFIGRHFGIRCMAVLKAKLNPFLSPPTNPYDRKLLVSAGNELTKFILTQLVD